MTPDQQQEWVRCAKSFKYFAKHYLRVLSLSQGMVPFELYEYQERMLHDFENNKFCLTKKFRQAGATTLAVLWALWLCMFRMDQNILLISITDRDAIKSGKIFEKALEWIKESHPWLYPELKANSAHTKLFANTNSQIEFRTKKSPRGSSLTLVLVDEAAFIDGMEEVWAALYPTISSGGLGVNSGKIILISTVNGKGNFFEKTYTDAVHGRNKFKIVDIHYTEHPLYKDPEWQRQTKANIPPKKWAQEYEASFLGSGDTYVHTEALTRIDQYIKDKPVKKKLFSEWDTEEALLDLDTKNIEENKHQWERGALHIWKEPIPNHEYIIGVDCAEGMGENADSNVFEIIDTTTMEQVAEFCSNTVPPHIFAIILTRIGVYYHNALVVVENIGVGNAVIDKLIHTTYYENLYYTLSGAQEKPGLIPSRTTRALCLEIMKHYVDSDLIKINSYRLYNELSSFRFNPSKKRAEAERGQHDDLVMALAMALHIRDRSFRNIPIGAELPTNLVDSHTNLILDKIQNEIDGKPFNVKEEEVAPDILNMLPGNLFPTAARQKDSLLREFGW